MVHLNLRCHFCIIPMGGIPTIKDLTFNVNHGETLAVIALPESGKSTLAWLCLRFMMWIKAQLLNGTDIKDIDCNLLRDNIAIAPQKSMLFTAAYWKILPGETQKHQERRLLKRARTAQADEFIHKFPANMKVFWDRLA